MGAIQHDILLKGRVAGWNVFRFLQRENEKSNPYNKRYCLSFLGRSEDLDRWTRSSHSHGCRLDSVYQMEKPFPFGFRISCFTRFRIARNPSCIFSTIVFQNLVVRCRTDSMNSSVWSGNLNLSDRWPPLGIKTASFRQARKMCVCWYRWDWKPRSTGAYLKKHCPPQR